MDPTQAIAWHDDNDNVDDGGSNVEEIPQVYIIIPIFVQTFRNNYKILFSICTS